MATGSIANFALGRIHNTTGIIIKTMEGDMVLGPGDYLVRGVKRELYPCRADIFEQTYEVVENEGGVGVGEWTSKDEVKARVLQSLFEASKSPNKPVILDNAEFKVFQELLDTGEFDWKRDVWNKRNKGGEKPDPCKPNYYKTTIKGVVVTPWDVIDALGLDFYLGNTLKYLWRFRDKGGILDLQKARTNLDKAIADLEGEENGGKS